MYIYVEMSLRGVVDAVTGHFVLRVSAFTRTVTRLETDASGCASII